MKIKRFLSVLTVMVLIFSLTVSSHASSQNDLTVSSNDLPKLLIEDIFTEIAEDESIQSLGSIVPFAWPGTGSAPQVSSVKVTRYIEDLYNDGTDHLGAVVKVYGYGDCYSKYNGANIDFVAREAFVDFGTVADGFYYLYDLGPLTVGSHTFYANFVSGNWPYTVKSDTWRFTVS